MTEETNKTLDDLLSKVKYKKFESGYVPSSFAIEFINFIKLVNGGRGEENKSPLFHYDILDTIRNNSNILVVSFRGSAKTSLVAEYFILYLAVFGKLDGFGDVTVGMYIGDTMDNGVKNLRNNLEHRYRNSEFLQKYLPEVKFTDPEWEFTNADGHKLCFKGYGANTGVRGFKKYGQRPQIAILDDLMSDKSAESKTIIKDIENIIYKAVRQAMHPTKRKVIWIGTPFNKKDPLYKAAGTEVWTTKAYPICEEFPCKEKDFIGAWEDRFPYSAVKQEYAMLKANGKIDAFNQELMLRILSDEDRLILDEDIVWFKRQEVLDHLRNYNIYT